MFYISPIGSAAGDGSKEKPWDMTTAVTTLGAGIYRVVPMEDGLELTLESKAPTGALKQVTWPGTEGAQNKVLEEQWALGYRIKRNIRGKFADFEKVR